MSEERNTEFGKTDCLEQKLKQMLSEELSDIQVSEALIQRTLQAVQKANPSDFLEKMAGEAGETAHKSGREAIRENRTQKQKSRLYLFRGCAVAAALLVVLGLGFRSLRFINLSLKSDGANDENASVYDAEGFGNNGNFSGSGGAYMEEPQNNSSLQGVEGGQWLEDSAEMSQACPTSYPGEWADGSASNEGAFSESNQYDGTVAEDDWDFKYVPEENRPAGTNDGASEPEGLEQELWISRAVAILLSDREEITGIEILDGFTEAEESDGEQCAYREFHYTADRDEKMEIIGRVYPDGRLEGKLIQPGQITYKAVEGQPEMEQLWEILNDEGNKGLLD